MLQLARYRELLMVSLVYPEFAEGDYRLALRQAEGERTDHEADFYNLVLEAVLMDHLGEVLSWA